MIVISWLMVPILCWSASDFAPMLTQLAQEVGGTLPEGGLQLAWWGMDIAEVRWAAVEACRGSIGGIAAIVGYLALCIPYFKAQRKEERAAAERMGVEYIGK